MRKQHPSRRTFSVKGQLLGKLGPGGYGSLLQELESNTVEQPEPKRKRRRGGRRRKAVAA